MVEALSMKNRWLQKPISATNASPAAKLMYQIPISISDTAPAPNVALMANHFVLNTSKNTRKIQQIESEFKLCFQLTINIDRMIKIRHSRVYAPQRYKRESYSQLLRSPLSRGSLFSKQCIKQLDRRFLSI